MEVYSDKIKLTSNSGVVLEHTAFFLFSTFQHYILVGGGGGGGGSIQYLFFYLYIKKCVGSCLTSTQRNVYFLRIKNHYHFFVLFFVDGLKGARVVQKLFNVFFVGLSNDVCVWTTTSTSILLNVKKKFYHIILFILPENNYDSIHNDHGWMNRVMGAKKTSSYISI